MASARLNGRFSIDERNINGSHLMEMRATRVYQRGRSRPARADVRFFFDDVTSVSKRPFPTSQSPSGTTAPRSQECIKEAVPDQPEQYLSISSLTVRVYQRGRSRPARALKHEFRALYVSVSKRPFPTSQSTRTGGPRLSVECIKEAVPDQPEPGFLDGLVDGRVYQRGRSRPARALPRCQRRD